MHARVLTDSNVFYVQTPHYRVSVHHALKAIKGRGWNKKLNSWVYAATPASAHRIERALTGIAIEVHGDATFTRMLGQYADIAERMKGESAPVISKEKTTSFMHQRKGFWLLAAAFGDMVDGPSGGGGFYLAHDMGVGKSKIVVDYMVNFGLKRVLIVCPKSVIEEWPTQFEEHAARKVRCLALQKYSIAKRAKLVQEALEDKSPLVVIVNFDAVWRSKFAPVVEGNKWDMIVADEIHRIMHGTTKVSKFFGHLSDQTKRRVGMSGTPMPNKPINLFGQMRFIDPGLFGTSFVAFRSRYCNTPDAPIWMADQTFKPIREVRQGDRIMGWGPPKPPARHRTLEIATVEETNRRMADNVIEVTLESGNVVKCTKDHYWLSAWHSIKTPSLWVQIKRDSGRGKPSVIAHVVTPPRELSHEEQLEAAWLAGIYDGEGSYASISQSRTHNPEICCRIEKVLNMLDIPWTHGGGKDKTGCYNLGGGLQTYVNILNWLPVTKRFQLEKKILKSTYKRFVRDQDASARMHKYPDRVVSIKPLPPQEVVSLQTSTGNYFAWGYASKNCIMGGFQNHEVVAHKNLDELHTKFYTLAHRVNKKDVLDLPPSLDEERTITLGKEALRIYEEIETSFKVRLDAGEITLANALVELLRLQQLTGGVVSLDATPDKPKRLLEVDNAKGKALKEDFGDLPRSEPIVVFCKFRHDLDTVHKMAKATGRGSAELSGRRKELSKWKNAGDELTVFAVQVASGGLGINLTRACYCYLFSVGFQPGEYEQIRARLDRQGQTRSVTFIHLIARRETGGETIDERIYKALKRKGDVIRSVLDDYRKSP